MNDHLLMGNVEYCGEQPMSRTYQYRKMKPLLERKRRARINRCLDELKDLMVGALQSESEGENGQKLEKADVLELTVKYLRKLKAQNRLLAPGHGHGQGQGHSVDRFKAGFTQCATEVSRCLSTLEGVDIHLGARLMTHLGHCVNQMDGRPTSPPSRCLTPPMSPPMDLDYPVTTLRGSYYLMPVQDKMKHSALDLASASERVWRPW
ncbi:unnamed protein product [Darwinula stevensoni]|uniref:Uncharacterized protein n=1 Tax=Darwinula stevensoni TaxID=69355 RepID=A0A7R9A8N5_9CRUS|nr:unnamed protein product [Darwinula stevensoni]CAG0896555.1 unnamed protein product [Darwinula stevensoni]